MVFISYLVDDKQEKIKYFTFNINYCQVYIFKIII
jgi:hypothetical protein